MQSTHHVSPRTTTAPAPHEVPDPSYKVHLIGQPIEWSIWQISQNLSDRWGDLNYHAHETKPLKQLEEDEALLARLRAQMWDEVTFIVRKDGKYGLLYEVEFCSIESEEGGGEPIPDLKPHADMVTILLDAMAKLQGRFPGVMFCVPDESDMVQCRPCAWAFVADGLLDEAQREALGLAMLGL